MTEDQISKGARCLADRCAEMCNVDKDDNWKFYGQEFIEDFRAAVDACGLAAPTVQAPVQTAAEVRAAALEEAALLCEAEKVYVQKWHPSSDGDEAYNAGCDDSAATIRALAGQQVAQGEKGGAIDGVKPPLFDKDPTNIQF